MCEGKITREECKRALNEMGIGKSRGSDGLTSEFYMYKRFWDEVGEDVAFKGRTIRKVMGGLGKKTKKKFMQG